MEPSGVNPLPEEDTCGECNGAPHDDMAQCDGCKVWFHFECVDVTIDTVAEDWQCRACHPPSHGESPDADSGISAVTREINALKQELEDQRKMIHEEKEAMEAEITKLYRAEITRLNKDRNCERCSRTSNDNMIPCDICKKWFHYECAKVTKEMAFRKWRCSTCQPPLQIRSSNLSDELGVVTREVNALRLELANQRESFREERQKMQAEISKLSRFNRDPDEQQFYTFDLPHPGAHSTTRHISTSDNTCELTRSQIAARKVVTGKLPTFSGNPDEWSNFKSRFDTTTRMCGYTDDENVLRLQECLTGRALKMVQSRLQDAVNVHDVMGALEKV